MEDEIVGRRRTGHIFTLYFLIPKPPKPPSIHEFEFLLWQSGKPIPQLSDEKWVKALAISVAVTTQELNVKLNGKANYYVTWFVMWRSVKRNCDCSANVTVSRLLHTFELAEPFLNLSPKQKIGTRWGTSSLASFNSSEVHFLQGSENFEREQMKFECSTVLMLLALIRSQCRCK